MATRISNPSTPSSKLSPGPSSLQGCLLRLFWILFGHLALAACAGLILQRGEFSGFDLGYWVIVAALVTARYLDITRFGGTTADNAPATLHHFRRFAIGVVLADLLVWIGVHLPSML
jgi:hypothetical protein